MATKKKAKKKATPSWMTPEWAEVLEEARKNTAQRTPGLSTLKQISARAKPRPKKAEPKRGVKVSRERGADWHLVTHAGKPGCTTCGKRVELRKRGVCKRCKGLLCEGCWTKTFLPSSWVLSASGEMVNREDVCDECISTEG
jgi:hypothetical protein